MKILHVPFCFHPDPVGGTEVYVQNLATAQRFQGAEVVIAAPAPTDQHYASEDLEVYRFQTSKDLNLRQLYGEGDPAAAAAFLRVLEAVRPDLVHLHAFTSAISLRLLRLAKQASLPVVFTYHTPTVSCQRGTLLRWGTELCSGHLNIKQCTACSLHGQGLARGLAQIVSRVPVSAGRVLENLTLSGGVWTALEMTELVRVRQNAFRSLMAEADQVVSLCSWSTDLLVENGVPRQKIVLCRHGLHLDEMAPMKDEALPRDSRKPCRIAFLGRITAVKGLRVLIEAIAANRDLPVTLDIYGVMQGGPDAAYRAQLEKYQDSRIRFCDPVAPRQTIALLRDYDVLAVPSQWLETGPLVVLEAFAAGIPVVGSDLGGIRELVRHDVDGLLVTSESTSAWTVALDRLSREPGLLPRLRSGVRPPRTMDSVAGDMLALYEGLLAPASSALAGHCS